MSDAAEVQPLAQPVAQLLMRRDGASLVLTLSNPAARNALDPAMYAGLLDGLQQAADDATIHVVVLTGAGANFCAGGNLNRLLANRAQAPAVQAASIDRLNALTRALLACPKPVIAAVEGAAAGAGLSLALACDLIVAADTAQFIMAYVKVGLSPDGGGSWFAARALPRQAAAEMMLAGAPWPAARLAALGVVNRVVETGNALSAALAWAEQLAQLSSHATGHIKALIGAAATSSLEEHFTRERDAFVTCLHHPDGGEAIHAFLEKRPARFQ